MTTDDKRTNKTDAGRWRRASVALGYGLFLFFLLAFLTDKLILRDCQATTSCSPAQQTASVISVVFVVAGLLVIGVLGWKGQLPGTRVDRYESHGAFLQRSNVAAVVLLSLVSGGFYIPVWFYSRLKAFNSLNSPAKLWKWGPAVLLVLQILSVALRPGGLASLMTLAGIVATLMLSFRVRSIIADHSASMVVSILPGNLAARSLSTPSSLLTFLINIWYLQYRTNELIDECRAWEGVDGIAEDFPPVASDERSGLSFPR